MGIVEGTQANFKKEVLSAKVPVLVDFNASWCPPCQALHPTLEQMANEEDAQFKIVAVDVDSEPALAAEFNVSSIPCLIAFRDGNETERRVGLQPRRRIEKMLGL